MRFTNWNFFKTLSFFFFLKKIKHKIIVLETTSIRYTIYQKPRPFMQIANENKKLHLGLRQRLYLTCNWEYLQCLREFLYGVWSLAFDTLPCKKRLIEQSNKQNKKGQRLRFQQSVVPCQLPGISLTCVYRLNWSRIWNFEIDFRLDIWCKIYYRDDIEKV